jgi:glycosyltransferase involved in cell wall biosynthesis
VEGWSFLRLMRIGVLDQTTKGWSAGASFTRMMLASLELAKADKEKNGDIEVTFLRRSSTDVVSTAFKSAFVGEQPNRAEWLEGIKDLGLDVIVPIRDYTVYDVDLPFVAWIPDFQHLRLPELFDPSEIEFRNKFFSVIAEKAQVVLVSSESARSDFERFFSEYVEKAQVAHFPSLLWAMNHKAGSAALGRFRLPEKFALVANQFWQHKNHRILPPTLSLLKRRGLKIDLVLTGLPADYRDPENKPLSEFFQRCAEEGVMESVHFLGQVPYDDLVALMRTAALIIQPSFFEGWSTSIEDSKALGRPLICSDIPVHREQVPHALGFFDPANPETLAELLAAVYERLPPGPDFEAEQVGLELARKRAFVYGCELFEMSRAAMVKRLSFLLEEASALSEERSKRIQALEEKLLAVEQEIKELESDQCRLRKLNHNLRRQSFSEFLSRNLRSRWRMLRMRLVLLRTKLLRRR